MTIEYAGIFVIAVVFAFINACIRAGFDMSVSFGADAALALVVYDFSMAIEHEAYSTAIPDQLFRDHTVPLLIVWAVLSLGAYVVLLFAEARYPVTAPGSTWVQRVGAFLQGTMLSTVGLLAFIVITLLHIAPWLRWVERTGMFSP